MVNATGIGSVPHKDVKNICNFILDKFPDIPFWPQLFKVAPTENMFMQFSENLPCLEHDLDSKTVRVNKKNQEQELLSFYDYFDHNFYEYFRIGNDYARGFHFCRIYHRRMGSSLIGHQSSFALQFQTRRIFI